MPDTKLCRKCNEVKPVEQFHKNKGKKDGLRPECAQCHTAYMVQWQRENRESVRARTKRWQDKIVDGETNKVRTSRRYREKAKREKVWQRYGYPERMRAWSKARRLRRHGLTQAQYDAIVAAQGDRCAICRTDDPGQWSRGQGRREWNIDHCHKTQQVRGLLCNPCNWGLHKFEADLEWGIKAVAYLQNPPAISVLS